MFLLLYVEEVLYHINGIEYKKLAPKYDFFIKWKNKIITDSQYIVEYNDLVLSKLNADILIEELIERTKSFKIILLCWEKPELFCHRHLISDWLSKNTKIKVEEQSDNDMLKDIFGE